MLFNSLHFLFFLPVVTLLYYIISQPYRWILIFIASCYFYMAFIPEYILVLFLIIVIDYYSGIAIEKAEGNKRKYFLTISLVSNILLLGFFKYFNFFNYNLEFVFSLAGKTYHPSNLDIILPIGLSFHTFQSMSYTIEVYRRKQAAEKHIGYFANYVLFFPQMVAGPIERYDRLGEELKRTHYPAYDNFVSGFRLILFGLFIKMVVADNLAPFVNMIYLDPLKYSSSEAIIAVILFSFQIYADFYGYSTIAVGCARVLGITIMDNFKTPYLSRSVSEFWSRWHISLSTWFRDYLYIPLGGNRVQLPRWTLNILIVFMVSGLWHGASWTFVVWGALHGVMLLCERYFTLVTGLKVREGWSIINVLLVLKTFIITSLIWIFFRATSFSNATAMFKSIFRYGSTPGGNTDLTPFFYTILIVIFDIYLYNNRFDHRLARLKWPFRWGFYGVLLFSLMALSGTDKFPFIYFQF